MASNLVELLAIAGAAFGIGLSGAMMPGPVLLVTLANVERKGPWRVPWSRWGTVWWRAANIRSGSLSKGRRVMTDRMYAGMIAGLDAFLIVFSGLFLLFGVRQFL